MSEPDILEKAVEKAERELNDGTMIGSQLYFARHFLLQTGKVVLGKPSDAIISRLQKIDDPDILEAMLFSLVVPRNWEVLLDQYT